MKAPPRPACRSQLSEAIDEWIVLSLNAERDRHIMYRRLIDGAKVDDLCEEFELSDRQIKDVIDKWFDVIFEHIQ